MTGPGQIHLSRGQKGRRQFAHVNGHRAVLTRKSHRVNLGY